MTEPIFLDDAPEQGAKAIFMTEKRAGMEIPLGDNSDNWQQEILSNAFDRLPYLSEFSVDIGIDAMREEDGYAFGSLVVRPPSQMTLKEETASPLDFVHIPVLVRDHKLAPMDIFAKGKQYFPLTEGRLRAALFRADLFDAARERPWEPNMYADLQPPLESSTGIGGGGVKLGSSNYLPILPQLHGRVREGDIEKVADSFNGDIALRSLFINANFGVQAAFRSALDLTPSDAEKTAGVAWDKVPPSVVQIRKLANGNYLAKWANAEMYQPQQEEMDEVTAREMVGDVDLVGRVEADGSITASSDAAIKRTLESEEIKNVDSFGLWSVQDTTGNELTGWCFPQILSFDLQPLPLILFTNGSQHALQEKIAAKLVGKSTELPKGTPRGYGCFYYIDHGTARAFVPMTIASMARTPNGYQYIGALETGEQVVLTLAEHLKTVQRLGENEYALPDHFSWMPLRGPTDLQSEPLLFTKVAEASKGEILSDGSLYTFRGPAFAKLATKDRQFLNRLDAEFLAVAAGVHEDFVKEALDKTHVGKLVQLGGLRALGNAMEKIAQAKQKVAGYISELPESIRQYSLFKEAAILQDAMTADKILSLNFINPENIATFVDNLPSFEQCLSTLAEMLMAVRLGMEEPRELAVERALAALESVVQGLHRLKQKERAA